MCHVADLTALFCELFSFNWCAWCLCQQSCSILCKDEIRVECANETAGVVRNPLEEMVRWFSEFARKRPSLDVEEHPACSQKNDNVVRTTRYTPKENKTFWFFQPTHPSLDFILMSHCGRNERRTIGARLWSNDRTRLSLCDHRFFRR